MQTPSPCRIVMYRLTPQEWDRWGCPESGCCPLIVVEVGLAATPTVSGRLMTGMPRATSIWGGETPYIQCAHYSQTEPGCWFWPPRVA